MSAHRVQLFVTPWTVVHLAPVHGIIQTRILEWVAISSSRDFPKPGFKPASLVSPALTGRFFTIVPPGKPQVKMVFLYYVTFITIKKKGILKNI